MSHIAMDASIDEASEERVVQAMLGHHAQLAEGIQQRVGALLDLVATDHLIKAETLRQDLLAYLDREILPHARAEEQALYPPAAALPEGRLLVAGMLDEHRALTDLVSELAAADTPVRTAAAARAVAALFDAHLHKENDLVLPLLRTAPDVRLATVLAGMHDLLGADADGDPEPVDALPVDAATNEGCGCGGCACGA